MMSEEEKKLRAGLHEVRKALQDCIDQMAEAKVFHNDPDFKAALDKGREVMQATSRAELLEGQGKPL